VFRLKIRYAQEDKATCVLISWIHPRGSETVIEEGNAKALKEVSAVAGRHRFCRKRQA
jgi:hypothetical protein